MSETLAEDTAKSIHADRSAMMSCGWASIFPPPPSRFPRR
jgi:hypothetical protein